MRVNLRNMQNPKVRWLIVVICITFVLPWLFVESITPAYADSGVYVSKEQFVFVPSEHHELQVVQIVQFQNPTNIYQTVKLPVPTNFRALTVKTNQSYQQSGHQATVLSRFLQPHSSGQVTLTYILPFTSQTGVTLVMQNAYFIDKALLYIPIGNMEMTSANLLAATHTEIIGDTQFRVFTRLGMRPGEPFVMNLSVYPKQNLSVPESGIPIIGQTSTGASGSVQAIANLLITFFILVIGFLSIRTTHYKKRIKDGDETRYEPKS